MRLTVPQDSKSILHYILLAGQSTTRVVLLSQYFSIGRISTVTLLRQEKLFSQDDVFRTGPDSPINLQLPPKLNRLPSSSIDNASMREASSDDIVLP